MYLKIGLYRTLIIMLVAMPSLSSCGEPKNTKAIYADSFRIEVNGTIHYLLRASASEYKIHISCESNADPGVFIEPKETAGEDDRITGIHFCKTVFKEKAFLAVCLTRKTKLYQITRKEYQKKPPIWKIDRCTFIRDTHEDEENSQ